MQNFIQRIKKIDQTQEKRKNTNALPNGGAVRLGRCYSLPELKTLPNLTMTEKNDKKATNKIDEREKIFCAEYMIDFNGTRAAIAAGYSKKSAHVLASRLLKKVNIRQRLKQLSTKRVLKAELTEEYIIDGFLEITERCLQRKPVMVFNHVTKKMEQAVEIDADGNAQGLWQFDSAGANKALTKLGEHKAMFKNVLLGDKNRPVYPAIEITYPTPPDGLKKTGDLE